MLKKVTDHNVVLTIRPVKSRMSEKSASYFASVFSSKSILFLLDEIERLAQ
jgi:hypothetical protein